MTTRIDMTPEGKIKQGIDRVLADAWHCYWHKPVQNGMGKPTLDYIGCSHGRYFAIEAKAPGGKPTLRQENTIKEIRAAGGVVFVIDDLSSNDTARLIDWLQTIP